MRQIDATLVEEDLLEVLWIASNMSAISSIIFEMVFLIHVIREFYKAWTQFDFSTDEKIKQ